MPAPSACTSGVNAVSWIVIPKGLKDGKFRFTVMATFDQKRFVAHGPFASDGSCNGNWCAWIRQSLDRFVVRGLSGWTVDVKVKPIPEGADEIWNRTFEHAPKTFGPAVDELDAVAARTTELIRDRTRVAVQASEQVALFSIALQLSTPGPKVAPGWVEATTIDHLFPDGPPAPAGAGLEAAQLKQMRENYAEFANCFLPVSPSLCQLNQAYDIRSRIESASAYGQLMWQIEKVYAPTFGTEAVARNAYEDQPIFTATAAELFAKAINQLIPTGTTGLTAPAMTDGDSWTMSAIKHMVSTVPYVPDENQRKRAKSAEMSAQNLLAALMAEPGLLGSLGLLFDLEAETKMVDGEIWVEPVWTPGKSPCFESKSPHTATSIDGRPKPRGDVPTFDASGFLKLGLGADSVPQFTLSDFRFDEAFRQAQHRAQTERNLRPQHSPGANLKLQPCIELVDFQSHDLALHWIQRPDLAKARQSPAVAPAAWTLHLEDLVTGIRPMLGRVDPRDQIIWFDLTQKEVQYGALKGAQRSQGDLERDGAVVPLVSFDRRTQDVSSVAELLCTWNGWGVGLRLPGAPPDHSPFDKSEVAAPGSLPPFRYGDRVCMAARLALRDGSCLIDGDTAATHLGPSWDARNELVVGDATDRTQPFKLHRWERLRAPLVMLDALPKAGSWWPADSGNQVILATSLKRGGSHRDKAIRYFVPARETDMFSTWKHGAFDGKAPPTATAFSDIAVDQDRRDSFATAIAEDGCPITLFKPRGLSGPRRASPYHPDPMVTHAVITLVRRRHAKSDQLLPVVDDKGDVISARVDLYGKKEWPNARALRVEVAAVRRDQRKPMLELDESDGTMIVRVPEGESFSLLAFPDGDANILRQRHAFGEERLVKALKREKFIQAASRLGGIRTALTANGAAVATHLPFLANATVVDVVHLLDRPFLRPEIALAKIAERGANETCQPYRATLTFDPGSTSAVEIYGSWIEPEGDIERILRGEVWSSFPRLIGTLEHDAMHKEFLDKHVNAAPVIRPKQKVVLDIEHETHDFKHRKIAYWVRGISNAATRQQGNQPADSPFAHPQLADGHHEAVQLLSGVDTAEVVHVLASRRPDPINYRYLVPAFRFSTEKSDDQIRRIRSSVFALHMDGSWLSSGRDEKLAVILINPAVTANASFGTLQGKFETLRAQYAQVATFWGADPLKHGEGVQARLPDFVAPTHFAQGTRMEHYQWRLKPGDVGLPVVLALLEPELCEPEKSWRVQIPLINQSSVSRPMVRFAFARYQPYALDELGMSEIYLADYAQLSNDREVVIARDSKEDRRLHVTVYGVSFDGTQNSGEARLSCWLERRCAEQVDGEAAWVEEGGVPEPWQRTMREGRACWHGSLVAEESLHHNRYRVAIVEEERYRRDTSSGEHGSIPVYFDLIPVSQIS